MAVSKGAFRHSAKRAAAARGRKRVEGSRQRADRERRERAAARRRAAGITNPNSKALRSGAHLAYKVRQLGPVASWPAEGRYLRERYRHDATQRALGRPHEGYAELYEEWVDQQYRQRYAEQQRAKRAAKPKKKPTRVRVRAHWRKLPG